MKTSFAAAFAISTLFSQFVSAQSRIVCMRADGTAFLTLEPKIIQSVSAPSDTNYYYVQTKDGRTIRLPTSNCIHEEYGDKDKSLIESLVR